MKNSTLNSVYLVALALSIAGGSWSLRKGVGTLGACCHPSILAFADIRRKSRKGKEAVLSHRQHVVCLAL